MPLVLDPERLPPGVLESLATEMRASLAESLEMIEQPKYRVVDPMSFATAGEMVRAAMALLDRPGARDPRTLADEVNLAYAVMLASIDLVKSHSDAPRVPPPRPSGS